MNLKQMMKKHYLRLVLEGVYKSILAGLAIGFAANFLASLAGWVFDYGDIWLAIGIGAAAGLLGGLLMYLLRFKPTLEDTAQRMDRLGLEERMITMLELKKDDSYMAKIQRENAKASIKHIADRKIKMRIPKVIVCLALIAAVLGSSMTTVKALADSGEIPSFEEIVEDDPYANYIPVTYPVDEGGYIEGETDQLVEPGGSTTPVVAVADDGWVFAGWDDGYTGIERSEDNVTQGLYFVAIFEEIGDLLFTAANLARKCKVNAEQALCAATDKFITRFAAVEQAVLAEGKQMQALTMAELDAIWEKVKKK